MSSENNYTKGFVGAFDILGFGNFTSCESRFQKIYKLFSEIVHMTECFEKNFSHVQFSILSDTIIVMIEVTPQTSCDSVFFESVFRYIVIIRTLVLERIGLYSRAGVTFGKYYYNKEANVIFGPAITRAVVLAEKSDTIIKHDERFRNGKRPVAILVDEVFSRQQDNEYYSSFLESGITYCFEMPKYENIKGTDYYIFNPYYDAFQEFKYILSEKTKSVFTEIDIKREFYDRELEKLKKQRDSCNGKYKDKYTVEVEMLNEFSLESD